MADIIFICLIAFVLAIIVTPIVFLTYGIAKKKKKYICTSVCACIFIVISILWICSHSTYYKYNDWWVIGRTIPEIEAKYGDFDMNKYIYGKSGRVAYYIYRDDGWIMPDHLPHYYYIEYDENGIATKVYDGVAPGG